MLERYHRHSLAQNIDQFAHALSVSLEWWVENIQPLSSSDFPDNMRVSDFVRIDLPKSRKKDFETALTAMGIVDEHKLEVISMAIANLQRPTVGENYYKICDHPLTIGELKTLSVEQLKLLNGFDKTTEHYKAVIIQKLFGLKSE